jgi:hypothetical protein
LLATFDKRAIASMPRDTSGDVLQGTLDLLVLETLALEARHGWGIAQRIQQLSEDARAVELILRAT